MANVKCYLFIWPWCGYPIAKLDWLHWYQYLLNGGGGGEAHEKKAIKSWKCPAIPFFSIFNCNSFTELWKKHLWNKDILLQPLNWQTNAYTVCLTWCKVLAGLKTQSWAGSVLLQGLLSITAYRLGCTKHWPTVLPQSPKLSMDISHHRVCITLGKER